MGCDRKCAVISVFASVIVVVAVVTPIAVLTSRKESNADGQSVSKPSEMFLQFAAMIHCTTKANPIEYQGYGCYCGLFNSGGAPVDETDRCCQTHDQCLKQLDTAGVCPKGAFVIPYAAKIKGCGKNKEPSITCKPHARYTMVQKISALMNPVCAEAMCQCDRQAAMCFTRHTLNPQFKRRSMNDSTCVGATQPGGPAPSVIVPGPGAGAGPVPSVMVPGPGAGAGPASTKVPAPLYRVVN